MNPKFKEFLKDNGDITMISLAWSLWWRLYVAVVGVVFAVALLVGIFAE